MFTKSGILSSFISYFFIKFILHLIFFVSIRRLPQNGKCRNCKIQLLSSGSLYGTYACAGTAIDAFVCVDFVLTVFFSNAGYRTFVRTCAACDARVRNLICHSDTPPFKIYKIISYIRENQIILCDTNVNYLCK